MKNVVINALTGVSGLGLSIAEQTSIPMVLYGIALAIAEIYKYKRSKNENK